ncbi:MAG: GAF domain-containing protein, partial [Zavarzinia sp.]|nr:GAF domain-containing protein [Zavarzinia sp.]
MQGRTRRGRGSTDHLERLLRAMARLHRVRDVDGLYRATLTAARELVPCDGAALFLREGPYSRCAWEDTATPVWRDHDRPLEACIAGRVMVDGRAFAAEDVTAGTVLPRGVHLQEAIRGLAVVPVGEVEVVAAIALFWRDPRPTCGDDLRLLDVLGDTVGAAIENLRRYQDIERVTHQMAVARDAAEDRLNDVAGREGMTGLLNRAGFYEAARKDR